jgi:hypothetical protein
VEKHRQIIEHLQQDFWEHIANGGTIYIGMGRGCGKTFIIKELEKSKKPNQ